MAKARRCGGSYARGHPHIHEVLEAMRMRAHLETATKDFHGHRVKAIEHLDQAIHETEICEHEP